MPAGSSPTAGLDVPFSAGTSTALPTAPDVSIVDGVVQIANPTSRGGATIGVVNASPPPSPVSGIYWSDTVKTLDGYGTGGGWDYIQIVTLGSSRTLTSGGTQTEQCGTDDQSNPDHGWWTRGLDSTYPYEPLLDNPPDVFAADGIFVGKANDHPSFDLTSDATSYTARQDFEVWEMYLPPGDRSQFVPLQKFTWSWGGTATWDGSEWLLTGESQTHTDPTRLPSFPDWTYPVRASYVVFR